MQQRGRVTIPTDVDVVPETLTLMERWGGRCHPRLRWYGLPRGTARCGCQGLFDLLHHKKRQYMGKGTSGGDTADVYYDAVLYGGRRRFTDPSHDASVPGYVKSQQP